MTEFRTRVLIVGGSLGAVAAALSCGRLGVSAMVVSEQQWLGGQLTSQGVPPDEHPWIESTGATAAYRELRHRIRETYRRMGVLTEAARLNPTLNPGGGHVSPITHDPRVAVAVIEEMLLPYRMSGILQVKRGLEPIAVTTDGDRITAVDFGALSVVADFVLDATETGALLPLAGVEYRIGAEAQSEFEEPHAPVEAQPGNQQAISWCCALRYRSDGAAGTVPRPDAYENWKTRVASHWPGPQLSFDVIDPFTMEKRSSRLFGTDGNPMSRDGGLWIYRRIASPRNLSGELSATDMTILNWPMIDYWDAPVVDNPSATTALEEARGLTLSFVHWLQNDAPRPDGGAGYPHVELAADVFETNDGLARDAYYRESRRIVALTTITENDIASAVRGSTDGSGHARQFEDSVGLASYRIDLHPSTGGDSYIDIESYPAQIPVKALIPQRVTNLLAASKNIGTTHLSNGMYRVHPAEWNVGEAAGALASWCALHKRTPVEIAEHGELTSEFQLMLHDRLGFELEWPSYIRTVARFVPQLQWTIREKRAGWHSG
jgi:hypothetical protein